MHSLLKSCLEMKAEKNPTSLLIISDRSEVIKLFTGEIRDIPIIVSTHARPSTSILMNKRVRWSMLSKGLYPGIDLLRQTKQIILSLLARGILSPQEKVLCVTAADIQSVMFFDVRDIGIACLKDLVGDRVDIRILESLLNIASTIVREGKEGNPTGALFIVGDVKNVMERSRAAFKDPFTGYDRSECNVSNEEDWATIKEFALLDGAFILDEEGRAVSAGRYIVSMKSDIDLPIGLGGRHIAAAAISHMTDAISIAVSAEGVIRVYMDGEEIYKIEGV